MTQPDWLNSPEVLAEVEKIRTRERRVDRVIGPMKRIPVLGYYIHAFWFLLLTEGPYQTLKPRWGGITFVFLNDGMGATVWHTWHQMTDPHGKFAGIYTNKEGAPSSRQQAIEWDRKWKEERNG